MVEKVYTLLEKGDTEEYHLFEGEWTNKPKKLCSIPRESICQKMRSAERKKVAGTIATPPFACKVEDVARARCAKLGRSVCGICVSHLYRTPED